MNVNRADSAVQKDGLSALQLALCVCVFSQKDRFMGFLFFSALTEGIPRPFSQMSKAFPISMFRIPVL